MSAQQSSTENKKHSVALDTRLQGRWLLLARGHLAHPGYPHPGDLLRQSPSVHSASANSLYWVSMRLPATQP